MLSQERKTWESWQVYFMKNCEKNPIIVSGIGVTSSIGQGKNDFTNALLAGEHCFDVMKRPGRQYIPDLNNEEKAHLQATSFLGAEIPSLIMPDNIPKGLIRTASFSSQVALATLNEAWNDANLNEIDAERIGLVVGGSNFQQRELIQTYQAYQQRLAFVRPTYAMNYMDSDLCGLCSEIFSIKGFAYTLGGASASGQAAVIQAIQAVESGQVDVCIAMGALMDLSYWECQGFRAIGAMGSDRYANNPELAARPFDDNRDGFIYGENCGVLVIEKAQMRRNKVTPYASLTGWAMGIDGNRNPNPSFEGEMNVIQKALRKASLRPTDIDYINPHGTGSTIGDETELKAIQACGISGARINTTKSIIGHGLSAAGAVEIIATLVQMQKAKLHPSRNLQNPIDDEFDWVKNKSVDHQMECALSMSMGFGGMNTAVCLQRI